MHRPVRTQQSSRSGHITSQHPAYHLSDTNSVLHATRRRLAPCCATSPSVPSSQWQDVLQWATGQPVNAQVCCVQQLRDARGRGLVAVQDIPAGAAILTVPVDKAYTSEPEHELELHWSADMAARLLKDRHACQQGSQASQWCTWLASLPQHVATPLEFGPTQLAAVRDEGIQQEIHVMQECMQASYEVLQPELNALGCGWDDFIKAVQVLNSRCFFVPETNCHIAVPGIDMANHSWSPTARVEVVHSPGAVQGLAALEEVADPDMAQRLMQAEPSCWVLRAAGPQGIKRGEEITISYGPWPDTAFFLLFGFVPQDNPHNAVVLFQDLGQVVDAVLHQLLAQHLSTSRDSNSAVKNNQPEHTAQLKQALGLDYALEQVMASDEGAWRSVCQLVVTKEGWDGRLQQAVFQACHLLGSSQCTSSEDSTDADTSGLSVSSIKAVQCLAQELTASGAGGHASPTLMLLTTQIVRAACVAKRHRLTCDDDDDDDDDGATAHAAPESMAVSTSSDSLLQLARRFTANQVQLLDAAIGAMPV